MELDFGKRRLVVAIAMLSAVSGGVPFAAQAQDKVRLSAKDAAIMFGAREAVLHASLSPDGTRLATVEPEGARGTIVKVIDITAADPRPVVILTASGDPESISWCRWAGNARLLCSIYGVSAIEAGEFSYFSRIVALDADGKNMQVLRMPSRARESYGYNTFGGSVIDWNTGADGHILMIRQYNQEVSTGRLTARAQDGLGVDDIDSTNLKSTPVERPRSDASEYISDGVGNVRIMGLDIDVSQQGYISSKRKYRYRPVGKGEWTDLSIHDSMTGEGFNPHYVDPQLNITYGTKKQNGRLAAYGVALDGTGKETLLLDRADVDVDGFATIGRNRRVIGVTYATDRREVIYTDPQMKRLATSLGRAMPQLPLINFVDSSQDEKKLLIRASSDVDPGRYYVFDRGNNGLTEVAASRLVLEKVALAPVKPIRYAARDGVQVPAYLTLPPGSDGKNLPAIVLPHGGPGARDEWGFDWLTQFWTQIGYAVLQPNFRGSSGYGDAWFQKNGFQGWQTAIGDVTDAGKWLVSQGIADPKKLMIFGWSYGGYAALQAAAVEPDLFRGVIAVAPVTDLGQLKDDSINYTNYKVVQEFVGSGPHIEEGSPARQAARIKAPVLMFHGTYDQNVHVRHARLMEDRLRAAGKNGRLVIYDKLDHYLDDSVVRQDMLSQSAAFFEKAMTGGK